MKTFRLLLTLLLCLTVPMAGWASVMRGPACRQLHHGHGGVHALAHHEQVTHDRSHEVVAADFKPQHSSSHPAHNKLCNNSHCACGCGLGSCASSQMPVLAVQANEFLPLAGNGLIPLNCDPAFANACSSAPLRPPIS